MSLSALMKALLVLIIVLSYIDNTPTSSVELSPTVNLSLEYYLAVQKNSYSEIRRKFDQDSSFLDQNVSTGHVEVFEEPQLLEHVLQPSRECVQESLSLVTPRSLIHLAATYFDHSENSSRLYLLLYLRIPSARLLYTPMHNSLDDLQVETHSDYHSLSPSQCDLAFDIFLKFSRIENPFLSSNSQSFDNMRQCLTEIRELLNHHMRKSQSRPHPAFLPSCMTKKEKIHLAQLDAAAKGVFVLRNDVDTIDRLVTRLHAEVENDMLLIHIGLERGRDKYSIQEILKQFLRNRSSFTRQLVDLEEHLILCFATINTRLLLLQEIDMLENPV